MIRVEHDLYQATLAQGGKWKLRAKALLAEGGAENVFDASVLLHEAARLQHAAVEALPVCPPVTRLASLAEECWCYTAARNLPRAAETWGEILRARSDVDDRTADAIVSKVRPEFEAVQREFHGALTESGPLLAIREAGAVTALSEPERSKARKALAHILGSFPGTTSFWWLSYRLAEAASDKAEAWKSLQRARRLEPLNHRFFAMSLLVAAWALSPAAADEQLSAARPTIETAASEVCLMYALAEISMARRTKNDARARWRRAREAANAGIARAGTENQRRNLRAVQLLLDELLANREPTLQILYLAGLADVAAAVGPTANVIDLLTSRARRGADEHRQAA